MTTVSHATAMYATKRRRRNSKNVRTVCTKDSHSKSNPSKRHRERLNQELDTLASLLPFEQSVLSKLDKLSILRLSVSYLRTKSYFHAALSSSRPLGGSARQHYQQQQHQFQGNNQQLEPPNSAVSAASQQQPYPAELRVEGDLIVQALNGFLLILTCEGEVFYTSHTVETYLGFHQSDICHQSVYELVHSEDREELMQQLKWNSMIPKTTSSTNLSATSSSSQANGIELTSSSASSVGGDLRSKCSSQMSLQEILASAEHRHLLERNFTVRFRCLLDNTSGFLRLDIRGRIKVLHGQQSQQNLGNSASKKQAQQQQQQQTYDGSTYATGAGNHQREPTLAFFGVCVPFGPPSLLEMPSKDSVFKSKHRLDLSLISMDSRGKQLLGLNDLNMNSIFGQQTELSPAHSSSGCNSPINGCSTASTTITNNNNSTTNTNTVANSGNTKLNTIAPPPTTTQVKCEVTGKSVALLTNTTKQQQNISAYDLVHHDDLSYMASAHQELLKTGASGLIAYRMITQPESKHQWLQTSAKLYYKNSKPDFILCTHRPLMEEEGKDLLGKRTMDFKVTYLDVGLSSINDRIMACDKFSTLQALSQSNRGTKSPSLPTNSMLTSNGSNLISSPGLSGESSRSLASLSPQSTLQSEVDVTQNRILGSKGTKRNKQYNNSNNYDLSSIQQQQQYLDEYDNQDMIVAQQQQVGFNYESQYKRGQNGDIFYDMDTVVADDSIVARKVSNKKKIAKSSLSSKQLGKKRDLEGRLQSDDQFTLVDLKNTKKSKDLEALSDVQSSVSMVDQQLHLYNHYNQHHLQSATATVETADSYPAIQAAAVYAAASLGNQQQPGGVSHQTAYGATISTGVNPIHHGYHHHHNHHNHHHHSQQSLYGSSSMVSPTTGYSSQHHHQHHTHPLHSLDSSSYHQTSGHYGAFGSHTSATNGQQIGYSASSAAAAAAASSFLPAEHLLHHYSQTAARSAALAGWPTGGSTQTSATAADYHSQHTNNHSIQSSYVNASTGNWEASAAAAAAAALVASASGNDLSNQGAKLRESDSSYSPTGHHQDQYQRNQEQQQYVQQQLQSHTNSSPTAANGINEPTSPNVNKSALIASEAQRYGPTMSLHHQAHQQQQHQKACSGAGPASLLSDGSTHRSPLSSGDSSNGSLAAKAVAAIASGSSAADSSALVGTCSNAYYLTDNTNSQQTNHHLQPTYAHHHHNHQQLAAYHHQSPYSAVHQYSNSVASHFNPHHHHYHHQHHQQVAASEQQAAAYLQHADLTTNSSVSQHSTSAASSAMAAVKLYGANGINHSNNMQHHSTLSYTTLVPSSNSNQVINWQPPFNSSLDQQYNELHNSNDELNQMQRTNTGGTENNGDMWNDEMITDSDELSSSEDSTSASLLEPEQKEVVKSDIRGHFNNIQDPLAQLISSTIGDIALDITPKS